MNTKQLRRSIISLAIQGLLVPQDPNDEPASELLKRINPQFTPLPTEEPLPQGWTACKMGEVVNIMMGQSPSGSSINTEKGVEFHQGKIAFTKKYLKHSNKYTTEAIRIAGPNSLLVCVRAPVGDVNITERRICIGRGLCAVSPKVGNLAFYFYLLKTLKSDLESKATGATFKAISKNTIEEEVINLPPLAEQERIVKEVERWFACIEQLERSREALGKAARQTKRHILSLAISGRLVPQDPNDEPAIELLKRINPKFTPQPTEEPLPQGWTAVALQECGVEILNGYAFKSNKYTPSGIRVIRITNVQDGEIIDDDPKFYPDSYEKELTKFMLYEGDLLMSLTGNVGRVGCLPSQLLPAALNQRVGCLRFKEDCVDKKYLFYLLQTESFKKDCINSGKGIAQLNISTEWLKRYIIPLPPLAEQERIVQKVEELFAVLDALH